MNTILTVRCKFIKKHENRKPRQVFDMDSQEFGYPVTVKLYKFAVSSGSAPAKFIKNNGYEKVSDNTCFAGDGSLCPS